MTFAPDVTIHLLRSGYVDFEPDRCPSCSRLISRLVPPDVERPSPLDSATRILPPRPFTIEPCGHEVNKVLILDGSRSHD
jgi:hypothetical protein